MLRAGGSLRRLRALGFPRLRAEGFPGFRAWGLGFRV